MCGYNLVVMRYHSTELLAVLTWALACGSPPGAEDASNSPGSSEDPPRAVPAVPESPSAAGTPEEQTDRAQPAAEEVAEEVAEVADPGDGRGEESEPAPAAAASTEETRTTEVIQQVVLNNRQGVRDCYYFQRQKDPKLQGTLTLHFEIDPKGNVKNAELNEARSTLTQPELVQCALRAVNRLKFPPSSRGFDSEVNYPFDLRP